MKLILRDAVDHAWLCFDAPRTVLTAARVDDVAGVLARVEAAVAAGAWAAGFVAYEAAPAFDPALTTSAPGELPLAMFGIFDAPRRGLPPSPGGACALGPWSLAITRDEYLAAVDRIHAHIAAGDTYQVNFTMRQHAAFRGDPTACFHDLARASNPRYGAFVDAGRFALVSLSPELFFTLDGGTITSIPMKGTAARGLSFPGDEAMAAQLAASEKNRAENVMIVDMVRNDIGRIAATGSVRAPALFDVERHATVWQMTSTVTGRTDAGLAGILRALFPPASVTGAPKRRAMEIIAQLENSPRGVYTGCIGFVAPASRDGRAPGAQFNVAIRTLAFDRETGRVEYGTGSGIVWESVAADEWSECETKTRVLDTATPSFRLLETLRWTPDSGYFLLDAHLRRVEESARYFQFPLDPAGARDALLECSRSLPRVAHRVRLLVDRDGGCECQASVSGADDDGRVQLALAPTPVDASNVFLYHKTTQRSVYDAASAVAPDAGDVLLYNQDGELTETCTANVCLCVDGQWLTPPVSSGLLAGTYRAQLLADGGLAERVLTLDDLSRASAIAVINSVRGWREAELVSPVPSIVPTADDSLPSLRR